MALDGQWAEHQVQSIILSSTFSSNLTFTACLQTPELQPSAHSSLHPRLLQVPSPTPGRLTFYLNATFPMIFILSSQFKVTVASKHHWWHCTFPVTFVISCLNNTSLDTLLLNTKVPALSSCHFNLHSKSDFNLIYATALWGGGVLLPPLRNSGPEGN